MLNNRVKVSIALDGKGEPVDCIAHPRTDANSLVEEVSYLLHALAFQLTRSSSCFLPIAPLLG